MDFGTTLPLKYTMSYLHHESSLLCFNEVRTNWTVWITLSSLSSSPRLAVIRDARIAQAAEPQHCIFLTSWSLVVSDATSPQHPNVCQSRRNLKGGKRPPPQDFSLTKKTARFTKCQFRPY